MTADEEFLSFKSKSNVSDILSTKQTDLPRK